MLRQTPENTHADAFAPGSLITAEELAAAINALDRRSPEQASSTLTTPEQAASVARELGVDATPEQIERQVLAYRRRQSESRSARSRAAAPKRIFGWIARIALAALIAFVGTAGYFAATDLHSTGSTPATPTSAPAASFSSYAAFNLDPVPVSQTLAEADFDAPLFIDWDNLSRLMRHAPASQVIVTANLPNTETGDHWRLRDFNGRYYVEGYLHTRLTQEVIDLRGANLYAFSYDGSEAMVNSPVATIQARFPVRTLHATLGGPGAVTSFTIAPRGARLDANSYIPMPE